MQFNVVIVFILLLNCAFSAKSTKILFNYNTSQSLALTHADYINGKWKYQNFSEEDLYEIVSPQIFNIVKRVEIRNLTSPLSDAYDEVTYDIGKDTDNEAFGIEFSRKDYYSTFKTYCLSLK